MQQIKIYGLGGQGVVTAANILAEAAAIVENKFAQAIPAYGHERRGAPVYADVIIDEQPIKTKSFVYRPQWVAIFDLSVVEQGVDVWAGATGDTVFIINTASKERLVSFGPRVYFVDARSISMETIQKDIPNAAMLGAMARAGLAKIESIKESVTRTFGKSGALNAEAAQKAYERLQSLSEPIAQGGNLLDSSSRLRPSKRLSPSLMNGADKLGTTKKFLFGPVATVFSSAKTGSWRNVRPMVNLKECTYCRICETYCPLDIVTVRRSEPKSFDLDYTYCKGCGICANMCPKKCIVMVPERGK